ncbi:hypothetical protein EDC94DRAFT_530336 [Helicostylum pulchrum]|nr:hypothetical protein EDC94DRAFT_530336 [Helicostylum pulchrum]
MQRLFYILKKLKSQPKFLVVYFLNSVLESDNFMNTPKLWTLPGDGKFIDMMCHILTDYYQSCRRSAPN